MPRSQCMKKMIARLYNIEVLLVFLRYWYPYQPAAILTKTLYIRFYPEMAWTFTANPIKVVLPKTYTLNSECARDDGLLLI